MDLSKKSLLRKFYQLNEQVASVVLFKTSIENSDNFYRRIDPMNHVKPNGEISSAAYTDPFMSGNLERLTTIKKTMKSYLGYGLVSLSVGFLREECLQEVKHRPLFGNYAHTLAVGKKKNRIKQLMKEMGNRNILIKPTLPTEIANTFKGNAG